MSPSPLEYAPNDPRRASFEDQPVASPARSRNTSVYDVGYSAGNTNRESSPTPGRGFYRVMAGDTLWKIAQRTLGDGSQWPSIHQLNRGQVPNPNTLAVGTILQLPSGQSTTTERETTPSDNAATGASPRSYTVRRGDTLASISALVLGDALQWRSIWSLNRDVVPNPSLLQVGLMLTLPGGAVHEPTSSNESEPTADERSPETSQQCVIVQPMDNLWVLAKRHLGDGSRWREILDLNKDIISNADQLRVGMSLRLPAGNCDRSPAPSEEHLVPPGEMPPNLTRVQQIAWDWRERHGELIRTEAQNLGIDEAVAGGILIAESTSSGFSDGRLKIRFEPHVFAWYANGPTVWVEEDTQDGHYDALERAMARNEDGAYKAISMGASQVMGFNAEMIGYQSAKQMFEAFQQGEDVHVEGMFEYFRNVPGLIPAAKSHDWRTVARLYNGPNYEVNAYHIKIGSYFNAYEHIMSLQTTQP